MAGNGAFRVLGLRLLTGWADLSVEQVTKWFWELQVQTDLGLKCLFNQDTGGNRK